MVAPPPPLPGLRTPPFGLLSITSVFLVMAAGTVNPQFLKWISESTAGGPGALVSGLWGD